MNKIASSAIYMQKIGEGRKAEICFKGIGVIVNEENFKTIEASSNVFNTFKGFDIGPKWELFEKQFKIELNLFCNLELEKINPIIKICV